MEKLDASLSTLQIVLISVSLHNIDSQHPVMSATFSVRSIGEFKLEINGNVSSWLFDRGDYTTQLHGDCHRPL